MITLPLDQMTTADKLRVMEELWADLTRNEKEFESPAWHLAVLQQREERLKAGKETPIDWEMAKKELLKGCLREFVSRGGCDQNPYRS